MKPTDLTELTAAANRVVMELYEAVDDPAQFEALIAAFDRFLEASIGKSEFDIDLPGPPELQRHFDRAERFAAAKGAELETPLHFVERQISATALLNDRREVVAANEAFVQLAGPDLSPGDQLHFGDAANPMGIPAMGEMLQLVRIDFETMQRVALLSDATLAGETLHAPTQYRVLRLVESTWHKDLSALLKATYQLTGSEIDVARGLFELKEISEIASARRSSPRTVRTQLNSVFTKVGVHSQVELVLFVAALVQVLVADADRAGDVAPSADPDIRHIRVGNRELGFLTYGKEGGEPVLLLQTTHPPKMSERFRASCKKAGLWVVSPFKPNSGGTSDRPADLSPSEYMADYVALLDELGIERAHIAGLSSAGLYALTFAQLNPVRTAGVTLCDTGVPYASRDEIIALPRTIRRTMLAARYLPGVLLVPHRIVAANFRRSADGEARVIDYFFRDSAADAYKVRTERQYYDAVRDVIAYSFEDIPRLVDDVCKWAADWSSLLTEVASETDVRFVHGAENSMFPAARVKEFCATTPRATCEIIDGTAQLVPYTHPEAVVAAIARTPRM